MRIRKLFWIIRGKHEMVLFANERTGLKKLERIEMK